MAVFGLYVAHIISIVEGCILATGNEVIWELNDCPFRYFLNPLILEPDNT